MLKEPSTIHCLRLASQVAARGKVMSLSCAGCRCTGASCVVVWLMLCLVVVVAVLRKILTVILL